MMAADYHEIRKLKTAHRPDFSLVFLSCTYLLQFGGD